jgi:hypothetical protein
MHYALAPMLQASNCIERLVLLCHRVNNISLSFIFSPVHEQGPKAIRRMPKVGLFLELLLEASSDLRAPDVLRD